MTRNATNPCLNLLYSTLITMLNADRATAKRLGSQIRSLHSHQSEQWCYEKAINELIRDRR